MSIPTETRTPSAGKVEAIGPVARFTYNDSPMLVYWEATRACELACIHCRAEAVAHRDPLELSTAEAKTLLGQIAEFDGPMGPHVVITGGDPLQRPDLMELIRYGASIGVNVSVTPAGTPRLTAAVVRELKEAGMASMGLSLDGSSAAIHDAFRRVDGSFRWTVGAAEAAREHQIPVQINTMVTASTLPDLPRIYELVKTLGIARWALFFLVTTGRGRELEEISAEESERLLNWLWSLMRSSPFPIKTTEAPYYRRIAYLKMRSRGLTEAQILENPVGRGFGIRDGNGIVFVSHTGDVSPSGFLPVVAGNVRRNTLPEIYRYSDLFRSVRDPEQFVGKCGYCEYRALCGGSRARAYAATGNVLESDPLCVYQPRQNS
jgi:AdoMet-dependent heme synthase